MLASLEPDAGLDYPVAAMSGGTVLRRRGYQCVGLHGDVETLEGWVEHDFPLVWIPGRRPVAVEVVAGEAWQGPPEAALVRIERDAGPMLPPKATVAAVVRPDATGGIVLMDRLGGMFALRCDNCCVALVGRGAREAGADGESI